MKKYILVASDVHRNSECFEKLASLASNEDCSAFLYAGDLDVEDYFISISLRNRNFVFLPVLGNCDDKYSYIDCGFANVPYFRAYGDIFLTHGHLYTDPNSAGLSNDDFSIVINGHSHISDVRKDGELVYLNPGSPSSPRGCSNPSYAKIFDDRIEIIDFVNDGVLITFPVQRKEKKV